jgi:endonuclease YncB( thermonuclease family)
MHEAVSRVAALTHGWKLRSNRHRVAGTVAALVVALCTEMSAQADEITGNAVRVLSGDTLVVATATGDTEIRLADIGAPQGSGYYAPSATTLLSNLVLDKQVRVKLTGSAGPNREFGRPFVGELDIVLALVQRGTAWVCWEYAADTSLLPYENDAIRYRRGLWAQTTQFDARIACRHRPPAEHPVTKR